MPRRGEGRPEEPISTSSRPELPPEAPACGGIHNRPCHMACCSTRNIDGVSPPTQPPGRGAFGRHFLMRPGPMAWRADDGTTISGPPLPSLHRNSMIECNAMQGNDGGQWPRAMEGCLAWLQPLLSSAKAKHRPVCCASRGKTIPCMRIMRHVTWSHSTAGMCGLDSHGASMMEASMGVQSSCQRESCRMMEDDLCDRGSV